MSSSSDEELPPQLDPSADAFVTPFRQTCRDPEVSATTTNAIDTHMMEIVSLRHPGGMGDNQGSVLAIVTFPKGEKPGLACDGEPWQDIKLRMSYGKLMSLGSKKITDMFAPRAQTRFRKRLGFEHEMPPGIEFVLDFTPPSEGPELADLTAALWLPPMVKIWFLAGQYLPEPILENGLGAPTRPLADKAVGAILTLGHDDVCRNLACLSDYDEWNTKPDLPGIVEDDPSKPSHMPPWRKVEDYCPIRHRVAIVRVLKAISGESLLLNSAVRLWTVAQVAISLEVPQVVVGSVTQWLVAPPNTKFIEICPERAFQLAYALKIPSVLITSFKILVNELAIDYASSQPVTRRPQMTWTQRRRDDYGDYPSDPVEYASRAFAERMAETLKMLQSDDVFARLPGRILEWDKLQSYGTVIKTLAPGIPLRDAYDKLTAALLSTFRNSIDNALNLDSFDHRSGNRRHDLLEAQRRHYINAVDRKPLLSLYWLLNPTQKLLTPFFWDRLWLHPTRKEFANSSYLGKTLVSRVGDFNAQLRLFLDSSITDPNHLALSAATYDAALSQDLVPNSFVLGHFSAFDIDRFYHALCPATGALCAKHMPPVSQDNNDWNAIPLFLSDHLLLSLDEKELNYLPIWADGLDDGSGGVFQESIPPAEMGPSEPGPGYHTGYTVGTGTATEGGDDTSMADTTTRDREGDGASTIFAPSDLGVGKLRLGSQSISDWVSATAGTNTTATAGRSVHAQRSGTDTTITTTDGRSGATPSESFTAGGMEEEGMYADARYAQPAAHQAQGQAIERYVDEAAVAEEGADGMEDIEFEDYSDGEMELDLDDGSSTLDGFEEVDIEETH